MHFSLPALAALLSMAQAVKVQVVSVGMNPVNNKTGLMYWPSNIKAEPGSMVQFQFLDSNHTVTQSNFDNPCVPIHDVNSSIAGIDSSFQPVAASASEGQIPVYTIMINNTSPLWFYCRQATHCESGMSLVINEDTQANATRSLANYQKSAASASPWSGGSGSGSGSPSGTGSASSPSTTPGAAAGLAVPGTMLFAIAAAAIFL